jgi:predicted Kef-type K+ transport protein
MASIVETAPLVLNVGVVLTAAATMGFAARKLGLPSVIGYLLTGLMVSPFTPGFVADNNQLALLADIGVVLLLFEVGIELDLRKLSRENKGLLWGVPARNSYFSLARGTDFWSTSDVVIDCNVFERCNSKHHA